MESLGESFPRTSSDPLPCDTSHFSPSLTKELDASLSAKLATCELYDDMNYINAGYRSMLVLTEQELQRAAVALELGNLRSCATMHMHANAVYLGRAAQAAASVYDGKVSECGGISQRECLVLEVHLAEINALPNVTEAAAPTTEVTQAFCRAPLSAPWAAKVAACSNYDACYASKVIMQDSSFTAAKELATSRQAEYLALKRIECLLTVLESSAAEQPDKLTAS
ncbi:unnamed protein product [Symbiodinium natans]|uniref:Uncharacterized protein n=1 Tax=Symbiodinium natans TaxID=878477 RepID=A0A812MI40_9DINO|nr:unnamed protein product [Symbiodinium natans]